MRSPGFRTTAVTLVAIALGACDGSTATGVDGGSPGPDAAPACDLSEPGTICTIAGRGEAAHDGDGRPAIEAALSGPIDTRMSPDGELHIVDWNNHRIRKIAADGTMVHVAGRGELGGTLDDPANDDFNHPTGILFDPSGQRILIAAWHNSEVRELILATGEIVDRCGDGRRAYFGDGGPALTASFDLPTSLAFAPDGSLSVMDQGNNVIRTIDQAGTVRRLAGQCVVDHPVIDGGPGPCAAPVPCPGGSGKLTCGDPAATCSMACNPTFAAGDALEMRMNQMLPVVAGGQASPPGGRIAYDAGGALLFADPYDALVRRIDPDGRVVTVAGVEPVDGVAQIGASGDEGPATSARLRGPVDLAIADDGTIYLSDVDNHCVRSVDPAGVIHTVAGRCGERGFAGDGGPATEALLKLPYGVEWADGVLYVADTGNQRIRAIRLR